MTPERITEPGFTLSCPAYFGRGAVGRLEHAVSGDVVDVPAGRDADAADLRCERVREIVAVQVGGRDHVEVVGPGEDLLQRDVGDVVLHEDLVAGIAPAVVPSDGDVGELLAHELVAPVAECALGELLDVALVDERDGAALALHRVLDGGAHEALRTRFGHGFDADAGVGPDLPAVLVVEEVDEAFDLGRALLELLAGVDVLGVLPEDHHVDVLGVLHRRRHAREPPHRPQAHVQVHDLAQRDVEAADAAADRRRQRPLDADEVVEERLDRLLREPVAGGVERLLTREHLFPVDRLPVLGRGGVEDELGGGPNVDACAVTLDERDDRLVGHAEDAVDEGDLLGSHEADRTSAGERDHQQRDEIDGQQSRCRAPQRPPVERPRPPVHARKVVAALGAPHRVGGDGRPAQRAHRGRRRGGVELCAQVVLPRLAATSPGQRDVRRSAASTALRKSIAMVVGPTPPTRGVMRPATSLQRSSTSGSSFRPS